MKLLITSLMLILGINIGFAQDQKIHARFIITDGKLNGVDVTDSYYKNDSYMAFYTQEGDNKVYFANVMYKADSQSYGRVSNLKSEKKEETDTTYRYERYTFRWSYLNTYDSKTGNADVTIEKIFKPAGIAFECKIVPENLDVIELKGYMEGSLQELN